jgi:hypothetical protein
MYFSRPEIDRQMIQNDRSDIWGLEACCDAVAPDDLLLSAIRTELSNRSLVAWPSFPVASLKGTGDDEANINS